MSEILESYKKRKIEWALKIGTEFPLHYVKQQASQQYEFLLSAARPGRHLKFSWKMFFSCLFFRKTDPQSSNYLKYRRGYVSLTAINFVRHFENEIPLTINHGRKMSTISGNE